MRLFWMWLVVLLVAVGCSKNPVTYHEPYEYVDEVPPKVKVVFPIKTYAFSQSIVDESRMSCNVLKYRTKRPGEYWIYIKKCKLPKNYKAADRHMSRLKSNVFMHNDKDKSMAIYATRTATGVQLKSEIKQFTSIPKYYGITQARYLVQVDVVKKYPTHQNIQTKTWLEKHPDHFSIFKTLSMRIFKDLEVQKPPMVESEKKK